ncbi:heparan-alpha-glucosaminide N-acetyltransferase domain-containing protein [Tamlana sp. 2_MG-2023]|uniref:acyltransferase family protein n=1 Tax=unclassified Tamlana TaxID=2614803 RepID=UPI0026E351CF|nr:MULTISPECIES: heparan-alpha-glucosaminide N-acetyltransferase domain-containing protein [unclassified Tamlana]MDO6759278.1 heparan-alpha-glucosaminide N-acetyltransferase domain-containing protein [Tamlana sp. 2_MG-2023]MDO6790583.1 heparan-alpha-glucosaminide N-acetyltransferase domain-containing protein [Tamlana sp. 1_MG-2023]
MTTNKRIESVDILRGMTIIAMILVNTPGDWGHVYAPLLHAEWHGLTPTDLIFPFFLYIVGISIYYAYKSKPNTLSTYKKVGIRSLKLIGLGLFLNLFTPLFPFVVDLETWRIPGVLQRIGIVFFIVSILYLNCNWKQLFGIGLTLLIGYYLFLGFVPLSNTGELPTFDRASNNWANYLDLKILKKHMWQPDYDPEGLISTIPSIASCLIGVLIGKVLDLLSPFKPLLLIAAVLLIIGYNFSILFPINKAIWSSSFVLVTSGWGTLILAIIYYLRDVKRYKFGSIFKYIGTNAITVYFLSSFISKCMYSIKVNENHNIHSWLYNTLFFPDLLSAKLASLVYALVVVFFYGYLGYWMYQKKIFIKV